LHPSASKPNMDETRFASTQVLKALHEDFEKMKAGAKPGAADAEMTRAVIAETPPSRGWAVPAGVGAVVLVAAIGGYAMFGRSTPPAPAPEASNTPPAADTGKPPESAPPATNATASPAPSPAPTTPAAPAEPEAGASARGSRSASRGSSASGARSASSD